MILHASPAQVTLAPVTFAPPSRPEIAGALALLAPWRAITSPRFIGMDRVPDVRPLLFVGNHTVWGVIDTPLLFAALYEEKGIFLRSLGDHVHFQIPGWSHLLRRVGAVDGTREACGALMRAGEAILVFPGGGREVAKRRGERYQLLWKERLGFARMAIEHRCTIVPFAAVGVEDALDVVLDSSDLLRTPIGKAMKRMGLRVELVPPIVKGIGPTPLPRPERLYFELRAPVDPREFGDDPGDDRAARALRDRVKGEVEAGIASLFAAREADPQRRLLPRLRERIGRVGPP